MAACKARTASGQPCKMQALKGSRYCFTHDRGSARQRAQARRAGGQARHTPHFAALPGSEILTAQDARRILAYTLAELLGMDNSIARARALLAVHEQFIRSFEVGELEQRLQALEQALNARKE